LKTFKLLQEATFFVAAVVPALVSLGFGLLNFCAGV
jgi:hypothetical protein